MLRRGDSPALSACRSVALVLFLLFLAVMASAAGLMVIAVMFGGPPAPKILSNRRCSCECWGAVSEQSSLTASLRKPWTHPDATQVVGPSTRPATDERIRGMVVIPNTGGAMWGASPGIARRDGVLPCPRASHWSSSWNTAAPPTTTWPLPLNAS